MISSQTHFAASRIQKSFMLAVAVTVFAAWGLSNFYHYFIKPISIDPAIIISYCRFGLTPKPVEEFVFLTLLVLISCLLFLLGLRNSQLNDNTLIKTNNKIVDAVPIVITTAFFTLLVQFSFSFHSIFIAPEFFKQIILWCEVITISSLWCWIAMNYKFSLTLNHQRTIGWLIFLSAMFLQIFAWRIFSVASVTRSTEWTVSFDAMVYALSQVVHGKTLLSDLPSQYGLFPEMIAPVFRLFGFSILGFTLFCAILQVISLSAIYTIVNKQVKDNACRYLFGIALVMLTFETILYTFKLHECYFQYGPIRFLWPALSVLAFSIYSQNPTLRSAAMVSLIGALGTVWNMDTGLMIVLAFSVFLIARAITLSFYPASSVGITQRRLFVATVQHLLIFILIIGLSYLYLRLKAHQPLSLFWLTEYQNIFYMFGFLMVPLPISPSPWMLVLSVYAFGILTAVTGWVRFPNFTRHDLIFYLSVLGIGIFFYYEGRTHMLNLIIVCWPALLISVLLADRTFRAVQMGIISKTNIGLYIITLSMLILASATFIKNSGDMLISTIHAFETRGISDDAVVASELQFIKENTHPGEQCLIYAQRQAIYYIETGLSSPIKGPGIIETLTTADFYQFVNAIKAHKLTCVFVGTGPSIAPIADNLTLDSIFVDYKTVGESSSGTMLQLMPKSSPALSTVTATQS